MNAPYESLGRNNVGHMTEPCGHLQTYGSCRSRARSKRAPRSLENPQSGFSTATTGHLNHQSEYEVTARLCQLGDREAMSLRNVD
jgi:hypothetical protein